LFILMSPLGDSDSQFGISQQVAQQ
jgi:hypothetical protein